VVADHLVHFVRDVVLDELDLSLVYAHYEELRGYPPYHPAMMTALLLYGDCRGIYSSRRIEQACEERVDFMALTGMVKPDHSTVCQRGRQGTGPRTLAMREKLSAGGVTGPYRLRKQVVEPVFGQIRKARGFRQFLHRGLPKVAADGSLRRTTHNVPKLYAARVPAVKRA
jgi:hypothetical protein